jgi:undecaprenyl-diphosphatase
MNDKLFNSLIPLSRRCTPLDWLMILISDKIRYVFVFVLIFMWFRNAASKKVACNAMISGGITLVVHTLIKLCYFKPRPFVNHRVGILIPSKTDSSFPSKHTLLVFAISTSILLYNRTLGYIMSGLSVLAGLSRIWVGHHYPSDIIGSALIATITSIIVDQTKRCIDFFVCHKEQSD